MKTLLWTLLLAQSAGTPAEWTFDVRHEHTFGACRGTLTLSDDSVRYETSHEDHPRQWDYADVESFEIVSDREIRIHTYESEGVLKLWRDRNFTLRLADAPPVQRFDGAVYAFLEARSPRPVRTHIVFDSTDARTADPASATAADRVVQRLPVRHDHLFGSCQGTLDILDDRIVYATDHPEDSRIWRLADLETFASIDDFDLRVSTRNETFHFDLKVRLLGETYQHIWNRVYAPRIQTYRGRVR